jgi:hypothetical protein
VNLTPLCARSGEQCAAAPQLAPCARVRGKAVSAWHLLSVRSGAARRGRRPSSGTASSTLTVSLPGRRPVWVCMRRSRPSWLPPAPKPPPHTRAARGMFPCARAGLIRICVGVLFRVLALTCTHSRLRACVWVRVRKWMPAPVLSACVSVPAQAGPGDTQRQHTQALLCVLVGEIQHRLRLRPRVRVYAGGACRDRACACVRVRVGSGGRQQCGWGGEESSCAR